MTQRIAALDLGTNTFHLIIADVSNSKIQRIVTAEQKHVKLGEGGINTGTITAAAFNRGLDALADFSIYIQENNVDTVHAVGTAALRSASNGLDFLQSVKERTGIQIEIISGDREASLIYQGVKQAIDFTENSLIMDIGGGSVEFIFANKEGIQWKKSYPIGAAKLMATFHRSDPISNDDIQAILKHLDEVLADFLRFSTEFKPKILIGSAGAFETFAALCQIKFNGNQSEIKRSFLFDVSQLELILSEILKSDHQQRKDNPAIISVRTDMIVTASVLTQYIISKLEIESVLLSAYALKEGLLLD